MKLYADILSVDMADPLNPVFEYQLTDSDETAEVSFTDKISLAAATYIDAHEPESDNPSAFRKMIREIVHCESSQMAGCEYSSGEES